MTRDEKISYLIHLGFVLGERFQTGEYIVRSSELYDWSEESIDEEIAHLERLGDDF